MWNKWQVKTPNDRSLNTVEATYKGRLYKGTAAFKGTL